MPSGPGDFRGFSFFKDLLNSERVRFSPKALICTNGVFSLVLRSFSSCLSSSLSLLALFVEAKYLLCSFAFLWSSAIVPSSVKRGLGFLVLFSPLRLFKRDQALVPSLYTYR